MNPPDIKEESMIIVDETSINFLGLPLNSKERVRKKDDLYQKARKKCKII